MIRGMVIVRRAGDGFTVRAPGANCGTARPRELHRSPVCAGPVVNDPSRDCHSQEPVCHSYIAVAGQTAQLKVTGNISVIGIGDAQVSWTFKTTAQTYKFVVGQLMRSVKPEPYTVTLSVK